MALPDGVYVDRATYNEERGYWENSHGAQITDSERLMKIETELLKWQSQKRDQPFQYRFFARGEAPAPPPEKQAHHWTIQIPAGPNKDADTDHALTLEVWYLASDPDDVERMSLLFYSDGADRFTESQRCVFSGPAVAEFLEAISEIRKHRP